MKKIFFDIGYVLLVTVLLAVVNELYGLEVLARRGYVIWLLAIVPYFAGRMISNKGKN